MNNKPTIGIEFRHELSWWQFIVLLIIVALLSFPLFLIINNDVPEIYLPIPSKPRIDHFLTYGLVFIALYYLARKIRYILFLLVATSIFTMFILTITGRYTFKDLYFDYTSWIYNLNNSAIRFEFVKPLSAEDRIFPKASSFREAIDYTNPIVRNYAAQIAVMHFETYANPSNLRLIQFFSIFKEIRKRWRYVYDPINGDYFAKASETVQQLKSDGKFKGDCDDYSILMAACIKATGGEVRLVRTQVRSSDGILGHVYPEVFVGSLKDLDDINYLISQVLFAKENKGEPIYYHIDGNNHVWLNFDYNDYYPGGKYQSQVREAELFI